MNDTVEQYEANAEAFYRETRILAPGKDVPAAIGDYDEHELRSKLWRVWLEKQRMADRIRELESPPRPEPVAWALIDNDGVTVGAFCSYESASEHCEPTYHHIVPLYAHPSAAAVRDRWASVVTALEGIGVVFDDAEVQKVRDTLTRFIHPSEAAVAWAKVQRVAANIRANLDSLPSIASVWADDLDEALAHPSVPPHRVMRVCLRPVDSHQTVPSDYSAPVPPVVSEAMVTAVARVICRKHADVCGVNEDDA